MIEVKKTINIWRILVALVALVVLAFSTLAHSELTPERSGDLIEAKLIEEAFERSQWMVRASHILVAVSPDATSLEEIKALEKIGALRQSILEGKSFNLTAIAVSDDPSVQVNQGDLGFFSVFEQLYPIETAAFETRIGAVSQPIKTRFGYHLIRLTERIPASKKKRVAHLLIEDRSVSGFNRAKKLYAMLPERKFEYLVKHYSDDVISRESGGDLGFDRLVNSLEKVRLTLELNQVSNPVWSERGWHLIKVTEEAETPELVALYSFLRTQIQLDNRMKRILDAVAKGDSFYPIARSMQ